MFHFLFSPGLPVLFLLLNGASFSFGFYIRKPSCSYQVPPVDESKLFIFHIQIFFFFLVLLQVHQKEIDANEDVDDSSENGLRRRRSNGDDDDEFPLLNNLRIFIYYDNASIDQLPTSAQRDYVRQQLVPGAVRFFEQALSLRHPSDVRIRLNKKCQTQRYFLHTSTRQQSCFGSCRDVTKCGEVNVPDEHLNQCHSCLSDDINSCRYSGPESGPGVVGADFILFVSAVHTERCHGRETVAYAAHCQQEDTLDRPIAGHVNLCPRTVSVSEKDQEVLISTVKHEILHALGFSAGLFAFYRDDNGHPLTERNAVGKPVALNQDKTYYKWSDRVVKSITRTDWWTRNGRINHTVHMVVTPRVQKEARDHFGCDTLEGAELENQGSDGTVWTHWEKRVFENEAMTGTHTQSPSYSRLTLALMEDTGWYKANYSVAESLEWGSNLGCDFATKSCGEWIEKREKAKLPIAPFCKQMKTDSKPTDTMTTCTLTRRSIGLCNMRDYGKDLQAEYQYFGAGGSRKERGFGGSVELADYCPYPQEFEWNNSTGRERDSRCILADNAPDSGSNAAIESYSPDSKCFNHVGSWTKKRCTLQRTFERLGAGCHEFECADGHLWLRLSKNSTSYPCYKSGQIIKIRQLVDGWLHEGAIICPSCQEICSDGSFECLPESDEYGSIEDPQIKVPCGGCPTVDPYKAMYLLVVAVLVIRL